MVWWCVTVTLTTQKAEGGGPLECKEFKTNQRNIILKETVLKIK